MDLFLISTAVEKVALNFGKPEQRFIDRFSAHAAKAAQVQSRVKMLEKQERIEPPKRRRVMKFDFRSPQRSGEDVVALKGVRKSFGARTMASS